MNAFSTLVIILIVSGVVSAAEPLPDTVTADLWLICDLVPMYKMQNDNKTPTGDQLISFLKGMDEGKDEKVTATISRIALGKIVVNPGKPVGRDFVMKYRAFGSNTWRVVYADRSIGDERVETKVSPEQGIKADPPPPVITSPTAPK